MRINPVNCAILNRKNSVSFKNIKRSEFEIELERSINAGERFQSTIYPNSEIMLEKINDVIDSATKLFETVQVKDSEIIKTDNDTTVKFTRKGFFNNIFTAKEYKGNKLVRESEFIPKRSIKVKEYLRNPNNYNLYEYNMVYKTKRCMENVYEKKDYSDLLTAADRVYTYSLDNLTKYEEDYLLTDLSNGLKTLSCARCFEPDYDLNIVRYSESTYDNFSRTKFAPSFKTQFYFKKP